MNYHHHLGNISPPTVTASAFEVINALQRQGNPSTQVAGLIMATLEVLDFLKIDLHDARVWHDHLLSRSMADIHVPLKALRDYIANEVPK